MNATHTPAPRIALGITGGIAAYKTAELVRLLTARGFEILPIMTPWATRFIGTLTLEALTGHQVRVDTPSGEGHDGIEHISMIRSVDLLVIAPLTANTQAKMVQGLADNFLTATYLAHTGKTLVCPAMNTGMLSHPATKRNLAQLEADGVHILFGEAGSLACGETGAGRMAEPARIVDCIEELMARKIPDLQNCRVLVTAGPTREDLDPVRYLSNRSSGKMGIAVARAFRNAGAQVTLVHGPVDSTLLPDRITCHSVVSCAEMTDAVLGAASEMDVVVMAAAVADYRPVRAEHKLKKERFDGLLRLERTTDILAELGRNKPSVLVGFAAESENLVANARGKLARKNLDLIFGNRIDGELGFGTDDNQLIGIDREGQVFELGTQSKDELARLIVGKVAQRLVGEK